MTRKDSILIAETLQERYAVIDGDLQTSEGKATAVISEHLAGFYDAVESVASALASDNPRFDREHFLAVVRGEKELTIRPARKQTTEDWAERLADRMNNQAGDCQDESKEQERRNSSIPPSVREARAGLIPSEETDTYADLENDIYGIWRTKKEKVVADGPYLGGIEHTVVDDEGSFIASCGVTLNDDAEIRARLIAAAPELLEALRNIEANLTGQDCLRERIFDSLRRARTAIAKAKGRS